MHDLGRDRRAVDGCGGVPRSLGLLGEAEAAEPQASGFTFLQISDSHIGFDKPANPNALGTLQEAIAKVKAHAAEARLHDPHRRHHASVDGRASSTMPTR